MKEQTTELTFRDTEELCKLYMDCRLSVLEEVELRYVLSRIDYHSPLIDDVRALMGIELSIYDNASDTETPKRKRHWTKRMIASGIAASIAISLGISLYFNSSTSQISSDSYYLAYADGKRLNEAAAKIQIEAEMQSAEDFMKEMSQIEQQEKEIIDNFITANPL